MFQDYSHLEFPDIMIDLETTGLQPSHNAIIQIAAVKFNLEKGTICHDFFDMSLLIPGNRHWQQSTHEWWAKRKDVYHDIMATAQPARDVIEAFLKWLGPQQLRFWGKPTHFDYVFLESYIRDTMDRKMPFHYREATDMNSWIRGRYFPGKVPNLYDEVGFEGTAHNAIHDVLNQIKMLFHVVRATTPQVEAIELIEAEVELDARVVELDARVVENDPPWN